MRKPLLLLSAICALCGIAVCSAHVAPARQSNPSNTRAPRSYLGFDRNTYPGDAAIPALRTALMAYQRGQAGVARAHGFRGLVMEGRDIGSVIFPDADFRFFLQADLAERKRRREDEGRVDKIQERDRLDLSRPTAPLACPPGAIAIDSTHLSLDEVVAAAAKLIGEKLPPA